MRPQKFFNNPKNNYPIRKNIQNRRDADNLIIASYKVFMMIGLLALRDEFEFGKKRLERWIDKTNQLLEDYDAGYISAKDINDTLFEETGIKIE